MKNLLDLQRKKYEEALETIAHLKEALYFFMNFDPNDPKETGKKVYELAFDKRSGYDEVFVDKNNFTPGKTFLRNGCKDTGKAFGTSIEMVEGVEEDKDEEKDE